MHLGIPCHFNYSLYLYLNQDCPDCKEISPEDSSHDMLFSFLNSTETQMGVSVSDLKHVC